MTVLINIDSAVSTTSVPPYLDQLLRRQLETTRSLRSTDSLRLLVCERSALATIIVGLRVCLSIDRFVCPQLCTSISRKRG